MSLQVSYKKQFLVFIIIISLTLLITESLVRVTDVELFCKFESSPLYDEYDFFSKRQICSDYRNLQYDNSQPFKQFNPLQNFEYIKINSDGFRGSEISQKSIDTYRIFILGGSTTFGIVSSSDQTTISGYLQKYFDDDEHDFVEIINAGVTGANSRDEYFNLKTNILEFDPDMIIFYDGWNDITSRTTFMHLSDEEYVTKPQSETIQVNKIESNGTGILKLFEKINYQTGIKFGAYIKSLISVEEYGVDTERINSFSKHNWMNVCSLGLSNNFSTVIVLQPMLGTSDRELSHHENSIKKGTFEKNNLQYMKDFDFYSSELIETCSLMIDMRNGFDGVNEPVFWDYGHTSDFGNQIIAKKMFEKVLPIVINDKFSK